MALKDRIAFGMSLPHRSPDTIDMSAVRQVAQRADALGFQDLWVTENTLEAFVAACVGLLHDEPRRAAMRAECLADSRRYTLQHMSQRFTTAVLGALAAPIRRGAAGAGA